MNKFYAFFISLCCSSIVLAASVQSVKNNKVLILLQGQEVSAGDKYFLLDSAGKKKTIIVIRQVKGDKAIADVTKGTPMAGYKLANSAISSGSSSSSASSGSGSAYSPASADKGGWGVVGSLLQSSMTADFTSSADSSKTSVAMKGMTFGALGFYDYNLMSDLDLRALAGVEQFGVSGTTTGNACENSTACDVKITYLSMYGGAKWNFYNKSVRAWVGGFYGFLFALSKSSSVLKTGDISTNQMYVASLGMDYKLSGGNSFVPLSLEYGMFPASATVKANVLFVRAGWGKSF